jgi:hypothetical protein
MADACRYGLYELLTALCNGEESISKVGMPVRQTATQDYRIWPVEGTYNSTWF